MTAGKGDSAIGRRECSADGRSLRTRSLVVRALRLLSSEIAPARREERALQPVCTFDRMPGERTRP